MQWTDKIQVYNEDCMGIRNLINSPDFKNIKLAIELNFHSREIRALADFYKANKGKRMEFIEFNEKFYKMAYRGGIKIEVKLPEYGDFEIFHERLAECFEVKIYHSCGKREKRICKDWATMDRLSSGLTIPQWMQKTNKNQIKSYKYNLPF